MKIILLLTFLIIKIAKATQENPILEIEDGIIRGILEKTPSNTNYHAFRDIPYATPPIGELRFTEPTPAQKWTGIRDTIVHSKICMQYLPAFLNRPYDDKENEDCLYISVFTPNIHNKTTSLSPVFVYIYGGMFIEGDPTEYKFYNLIDEGIVAVSFSFRSSSLGFLSTDDGVIPANLGIKDQIQALQWVQSNIKHFGGDPKKVTIGGGSSGAVCVGYLVLNPKAAGLFRAAIMQSGSALSPMYSKNATEVAYTFAERFDPDIRTKSTRQLLKLLRSLPADVITRAEFVKLPHILRIDMLGDRALTWRPNLDESIGPMHDSVSNGDSNHVPVLAGISDEEGLTLNVETIGNIDANLSNILNPTFTIKPGKWEKACVEVKNFYTQTEKLKENTTALIKVIGDLTFSLPTIKFAYLHSKFADTYFYQFSYKGPMNGLHNLKKTPYYNMKGLGKAEHSSELPFLYHYRLNPKVTPSKEDLLVRKKMVRLWANFIKYLNPTPIKEELLEKTVWPKVTQSEFKFIDIGANLSVKSNPRRIFEWQERMEKYFDHPRYVL